MARISITALGAELVGKLAGSVFQYSYGGWQVRTRVSPRNPQTQYQQLRRMDFGFIAASWRALTPTQRNTFIAAATTPPEAFNLFMAANINLILIGEPMITTYTPTTTPATMVVAPIDANPEEIIIQATGMVTAVPAGTKLLFYSTFDKSQTKIFTNPSEFSPIITFDEGTDLSIPVNVIAAYNSLYGQLRPDMRICVKSVLIDKTNGLRGAETINCSNTTQITDMYKRISFVATDTLNTTTAPENINLFSVLANTLVNDGDSIKARYVVEATGGGTNNSFGYLFASASGAVVSSAASMELTLEIEIFRRDSTHAIINCTVFTNFAPNGQTTQVVTAIDWTINNQLAMQVTGNAVGSINTHYSTIDYIRSF